MKIKVNSKRSVSSALFKGTCCVFIFLLSVISSANAQDKQMYQVKTLNQQLLPYGDLKISINENQFISMGNKGEVFIELGSKELPIKSIKVDNEKLEVASWNISKGILSIIIRKKSYQLARMNIKDSEGISLKGIPVIFKGKKEITATTNNAGQLTLPLPLDETITSTNQFEIEGYNITDLQLSEGTSILMVEKVAPQVIVAAVPTPQTTETAQQPDEKIMEDPEFFENFDLNNLDSIQSLTAFYAVFKNYQIKDMEEHLKERVDAKFNELVGRLQNNQSGAFSFINKISDSSFVQDDINNLLTQAKMESQLLVEQQSDFEGKINLINNKLAQGLGNMNEDSRISLLADLNMLQQILTENESRFYKNHSRYQVIINNLKEQYFNFEDLEDQLSMSEALRAEEQKIFRERLIAVVFVALLFAVLILVLIYFSNKLKKRKEELEIANAEVKRINENLEKIVYERTKLLEETNKELDTVLYRASHDLRSPVCSIIGLCNIASTMSNDENKDLLERMVQTTVGMDKLLKKLSVISEINQPGDYSPIALCEVIENIRYSFKKFIEEHKINFIVECPEDLIIHTNANLIEVILANLIDNALFYCILKDSKDYKVILNTEVKDNVLELSLYDNGIGVEESISDKLFEMFYRGNENSKGNGLGLYIVRKSVHALNGDISVNSEPGKFSKFVIHLPIEVEEEAEVVSSAVADVVV